MSLLRASSLSRPARCARWPPAHLPRRQVCTSELGAAAKHAEDFAQRGVKLLALSCNTLESHKQ